VIDFMSAPFAKLIQSSFLNYFTTLKLLNTFDISLRNNYFMENSSKYCHYCLFDVSFQTDMKNKFASVLIFSFAAQIMQVVNFNFLSFGVILTKVYL
jgi:hypothetical protein